MRGAPLRWVVPAVLFAAPAAAQMDSSAPLLPPVVREEQPVPGFLKPNDSDAEDYRVEWVGTPLPDVTLELEKNSLQWARVDGVLRLPRGRLEVRAADIEGGTVAVAGFVQVLTREKAGVPSDGSAQMLVPLVSGEGNGIAVTVIRGGKEQKGAAVIRYAPRKKSDGPRIFLDTTCSPFNLRFESKGGRDDTWMYVGCRNSPARAKEHRTNSLELVVFWDNVGPAIAVDGVQTESGGDAIWNLRASSSPGFVTLAAGDHEVTLRYALASWPRKGSLGFGIGPYFDTFEGTGNDRQTFEPLVTVYASYALTPWSRLVAFNATPIRADTYTDTGLYLQRRTSDSLDRRVSANVFLGGHFIAFTAVDPFDPEKKKGIFFRFSGPQGVEFLVRDVPTGYNIIAGGLTNPGIGGQAYYNLWLRWGNANLFFEINYIGWKEQIRNPDDDEDFHDVNLQSIGLSVGFPLFKFL